MSTLYLAFCPYLSISPGVSFDGWELAPVSQFSSRWADTDFERLATTFLSRFVDYRGDSLSTMTLLGTNLGMTGLLPLDAVRDALQVSLQFAVLDTNRRWTPNRRRTGWRTVTADNADLFFWPIDIATGDVTLHRGSVMLSCLDGGWQATDPELRVPSPVEVEPRAGVTIETDVLEAVYRLATDGAAGPHAGDARRVLTAIGWLAKAWRNTPSIKPEDRIVLLKTGFEALTGESDSIAAARSLRSLFEAAVDGNPVDQDYELLWSPNDTASMPRVWTRRDGTRRQQDLTPLEHWFMAFADRRNEIIHQGAIGAGTYTQSGSPFEGPFIFTAEWVLRMAIKMRMHLCGYAELWRTPMYRAVARAFAAGGSRQEPTV